MVRSMFSGVSGMRSHQTRMDVIGNNIANVNTYGFKSSRATFRDIYYQSTKNASKGTAARGGVNPSAVGVGTQTASIDVLQQRSTFTQTDYSMDVAIDGEGFFQIQDAEGNKFYTRAGQLNFDSAGNLVDALGNFVLGVSGNPIGKAADSKIIQLNAGTVTPAASSCEADINGVKYTIAASTQSDDGNVAIQFGIAGAGELAIGQKLRVDVTSTSIAIYLNPDETFTSLNDLQTEMNAAIREACIASTGKEHPGGTFTITASENVFPADGSGLTGQEIVGNNFGTNSGKINDWTLSVAGGFLPTGTVSSNFGTSWTATPSAMTDFRIVPDNAADPTSFNIIATIDNKTYQGTVSSSATSGGKLWLYGGDDGTEYFEVNYPSFQTIKENCTRSTVGSNGTVNKTYDKFSTTSVGQSALMSAEKTVAPDPKEYSSTTFTGLKDILMALGGTAADELKMTLTDTFGKIWPNNGTFSSMTLTPNGTAPDSFSVTANITVNGATIPFNGTLNSASNGTMTLSNSATGDSFELTGLPSWATICNTLRTTSYDAFQIDGTKIFNGVSSPSLDVVSGDTLTSTDAFLSEIFKNLGALSNTSSITLGGTWPNAGATSATISGMTVVPQAIVPPATTPPGYDITVTMTDSTGAAVTFTGVFNGNGAVTLNTTPAGPTLDFAGLPSLADMNDGPIKVDSYNKYDATSGGITLTNFTVSQATVTNTPIAPTATASAPSNDIGLGSTKFNLTGGTAGGIVGMEDLTSVAIGTDGTITAEHPTIGTIYIGRIDLVTFTNPQALIEAGSTYFEESLNSGNKKYCKPGTGGSGQLVSGSLELSNADLSKEFTDMITTQRGFQANSRVITVSDTMLEELVNLKR